jgi:DNA-directed RNA polymerase I subunit RPA49
MRKIRAKIRRRVQQYFKELGCKTVALTEAEREKKKINKAEARSHKMAKLRIPLDFPKVRVIRNKNKR